MSQPPFYIIDLKEAIDHYQENYSEWKYKIFTSYLCNFFGMQ